MSNPIGTFTQLSDAGGICVDTSSAVVAGVAIKSALAGTLTITGVSNLDGSPAGWVIPSTTVGWVNPAGNSAGLCSRVSFQYSNVADSGKAFLLWTPR